MTDTTQQVAPQAPQTPMTNEQRIDAIKTFLFGEHLKYYQALSGEINKLPTDANIKRIIIEKLDDVWLWVKEAFNVLNIVLHDEPKVEVKKPKSKPKKKK